jgi:proteasome assembly chaperone (PAC2) family protein
MRKIEDINFNSPPIMFAAWPGMGNVALMAMDYLRRTVDARLFAELDMEPFYVQRRLW